MNSPELALSNISNNYPSSVDGGNVRAHTAAIASGAFQTRAAAHKSDPKRTPLPFSVRLARTEEQLQKAVVMRAAAYGRHVPSLAEMLAEPEHIDRQRGTVVFLAESKSNGDVIGTLRIQTNHSLPLKIEQSVQLPTHLTQRSLVEVTRLGIATGRTGPLVKLALFKALHRYCIATQIDWIVIGARTPLDRMYTSLNFVDLGEEGAFIPLHHSGGIPHRILGFDVVAAERIAYSLHHPLYDFMFVQFHPDIQVFSSVSSSWERPREKRTEEGTREARAGVAERLTTTATRL